jgi:hypothetical protein
VTKKDLSDTITVESAVLEELAKELAEEGMLDHATRVLHAIAVADGNADPVDKVKEIVVLLRPVDYDLENTKHGDISKGLRRIRRRLTFEANRLLPDTLKVRATGEYVVASDDDKKKN